MGVLAALDQGQECDAFVEDDEQMLRTFAATPWRCRRASRPISCAARWRLRTPSGARWARELHAETLRSLDGRRVLLSAALRLDDLHDVKGAVREAVQHVGYEIENVRAIITELRPAALDELRLQAAMAAPLERHREHSGFEVEAELGLPSLLEGEERLDEGDEAIETAVYRLVQEALTNVAKHARANCVRVGLSQRGDELLIEVQDDGAGFDSEAASRGFVLAEMRERASLAGGTLKIDSGKRRTLVSVRLPALSVPRTPYVAPKQDIA